MTTNRMGLEQEDDHGLSAQLEVLEAMTAPGDAENQQMICLLLELKRRRANQQALESELQEYRKAGRSIFPGVMRCPECDFSRTYVNVTPAGNYAGEGEAGDCPNGCGPLCHDTYKRQYDELYDHAQQLKAELQEYRKAEGASQ